MILRNVGWLFNELQRVMSQKIELFSNTVFLKWWVLTDGWRGRKVLQELTE
jgi:hypothetical protein